MWKKIMAVVLLLSVLGAGQAQAETRTKITDVHLHVESEIVSGVSGGNVRVTTSDSEYQVAGVEVLNEDDDWIGGMRPRIAVDLCADNGYYFGGKSKSMFTFTGDEVSYSTARLEDSKTTLVVTLKLDKLENGDLTVTGAYWDETDGTAIWDDNPNAKYYQVKLYRDDDSISGTRTTEEHYYEFADEFTKRGDYYFEVRAVGGSSEKGEWESSDTWYVSRSEAEDISGDYSNGPGGNTWGSGWGPGVVGSGYGYYGYNGYYGYPGNYGYSGGPGVTNNGNYGYSGSAVVAGGNTVSSGSAIEVGSGYARYGGPGISSGAGTYVVQGSETANVSGVVPPTTTGSNGHWCLDQNGWWYEYNDHTYPYDCWQQIGGLYYCFDASGYLRYGWIYWDNKWYYTGSDGSLMANTRTPDGYYVGGDGVWIP